MTKLSYKEQLLDPRWQKKRLEIFNRDNWTCQHCFDKNSTLHLHHMVYEKCLAWEAYELTLITVCEKCHYILHNGTEKEKVDIFIRLWFMLWLPIELSKCQESEV